MKELQTMDPTLLCLNQYYTGLVLVNRGNGRTTKWTNEVALHLWVGGHNI